MQPEKFSAFPTFSDSKKNLGILVWWRRNTYSNC